MSKRLICSLGSCDREATARGFCHRHYQQWRLTGKVTDAPARIKVAVRSCKVSGCGREALSRGMCNRHYQMWLAHGDPSLARIRRPKADAVCSIEGCGRKGFQGDLCRLHNHRLKTFGDPLKSKARVRKPELICRSVDCDNKAKAAGYCHTHYMRFYKGQAVDGPIKRRARALGDRFLVGGGYWVVLVPSDTPGCFSDGKNGLSRMLEHRYVMQRHVGRPLLPEEQPHHINGDRADNRLENLELWVSSHPSGQRVEDHLNWAREIIRRYGDLVERSAVSAPRIKP